MQKSERRMQNGSGAAALVCMFTLNSAFIVLH